MDVFLEVKEKVAKRIDLAWRRGSAPSNRGVAPVLHLIVGFLYQGYAPSADRIDATIDSASRSICTFDSASIITRASASVPE
jgi:hypothetical protein